MSSRSFVYAGLVWRIVERSSGLTVFKFDGEETRPGAERFARELGFRRSAYQINAELEPGAFLVAPRAFPRGGFRKP